MSQADEAGAKVIAGEGGVVSAGGDVGAWEVDGDDDGALSEVGGGHESWRS